MYIEFKPGQKYAAKHAETADSPDAFKDCGYLLTDDEIVIDIDSLGKDKIRKMIDYFNIDTQIVWTDRGAHLYFKKPPDFTRAKNGPCALGFSIESKHKKNSPRGITIKRNGILREIENEGKRQELPWFFHSQKQYADLAGMEEGEGRNTALFAHRARLADHEDTVKVLEFINTVIFDEPLPDDEFQSICREYEAIGDGKSTEYAIATNIMERLRCVVHQGMIWWWDGQKYINDSSGADFRRIIYRDCPGKNTRFVEEVEKQVFLRSRVEKKVAYPIRFKNGFVSEGSFTPIENYREFTPFYIDIDYLPDAEVMPEVDAFIDNLTGGDADYRKLLLEAMSYVMITDPEKIRAIGVFFMFRGDGANGKGSTLAIMRKIYGDDNCTALSIKDLTDMRYQVTMIGKLANLGDDVQPEAINNDQMKVLKNISTADLVATRMLYKQSISATFTTKLYFTTNSDIRSFEKGYAYKRRVKWLPMFNKVEKPDPKFITRMTSKKALEYWIRLLVEAYQRLYRNGKLTESAVVEEYNKQYHIENNYMSVFLQAVDIEEDILNRTGTEVRETYRSYNDDDTKPYKPKLLLEALKEYGIVMGQRRREGRPQRVFIRACDKEDEESEK